MIKPFLKVALILSLINQAQAQSIGSGQLGDFQKQLRTLLYNVQPQENYVNYLWEMSVHFSDTSYYTTTGEDTLNRYGIGVLYEELYYMQYDTNKMDKVDTLLKSVDVNYDEDSIPLVMVYVDYAKTKWDSILLDTNYFSYDTSSNEIFDLVGRTNEPLVKKQVFQVVPMITESYFGDIDFAIDTSLNLLDSNSKAILSHPNTTVYVDFNDSIGIRQVDFTSPSTISCNYTDSGAHVISVYVEYDEDTIARSRAWHANKRRKKREKPDLWGSFSGLRYGVYEACGSNDWTEDKLFILCGGFDDVLSEPLLNPSDRKIKKKIAKWYDKKMRRSGLADLRNHGYSIVVLDYSSTRESVITKGWELAEFIDDLKCKTSGNDEQFVVMGTSYGARVAQFALALMETEEWAEEFPGGNPCDVDQLHKTRLFISQEGPHVGDNVPLSIQHMAFEIASVLPSFKVASWDANFLMEVIESRGFRENTLYHVLTENNNTYGPDQVWFDVHDSLRGMKPNHMGFPEFCKNVAVVNGMLTGERQFSPIAGQQNMADGALFLESTSRDWITTILGLEFNFFERDQELFLNPNGSGTLTDFRRAFTFPTLNLIWVNVPPFLILPWIEINLVTNTTTSTRNGVDLEPVCSRNGGKIGDGDGIIWRSKKGHMNLALNLINIATGECSIDGRFSFLLNPVTSRTDIFSDGLVMNFGPVGSAMMDDDFYQNFRNGNVVDFDRDYNADLEATFDDTPFDVIMGMLPEVDDHLWHGQLENYLLPDSLSNGKVARILNLEVGDDTLFIENFTIQRRAKFSAAIDVSIGTEINPFYEYPTQFPSRDIPVFIANLAPNNGIISRNDSFRFQIADSLTLRYGQNLETDASMILDSGATLDSLQQFIAVCPFDYSEEFILQKPLLSSEANHNLINLTIYPNPTSNNLYVTSADEIKKYVLFNGDGTIVKSMEAPPEINKISLEDIPSGIYLLQLHHKNHISNFKVIKL